MPYAEIVQTLHDMGWSPFACPAPDPVALAIAGGKSDESIVSMLNTYVENAFSGSSFYPTFEQASYSLFCEGKEMWALTTSLALGQQVEVPTAKIAPAHTVSQWLANMQHGYTRLGDFDGNCGPDSEQGKLRRAAAKIPPPEWVGHEGIWELAILSGSIQVGLTGFEPAYASKSPTLREIRGLDPQQFLDNLWTPGTWQPVKASK